MSQQPVEGSQPDSAASEPTDAQPQTSAEEPVSTTVEASADSPRSSGVTVPVAVPVTVALVLGLAIGLILGWVIPRPGDEAAAGTADADTAVAEGGTGAEGGAGADGTAEEAAPAALDPPAPQPVTGGPTGTEEVAGLLVGESGQLIEVFEDYVCPFCARLELNAGADLREAALSGEYRLVVHPIAFLTDDSPRAANASACVYEHDDLETWVAYHEGIYERQDPSESVGQYSTEVLVDLADEVGASAEAAACITDETFVPWVEAITQQAFARGVRGTPTLTLDGTITDVAPFVQ